MECKQQLCISPKESYIKKVKNNHISASRHLDVTNWMRGLSLRTLIIGLIYLDLKQAILLPQILSDSAARKKPF